ncbi:MAG: hypothetical protein HY760_09250, partial [Nitrospirae bacterium]|nr:hypothetical protein [Nitrospirota bacterium]
MALPGTPWTRLPTRASRGVRQFPPFFDRRRKTLGNRSRRFLNNYWLVPVFAAYLELFAVALPSGEAPLEQMVQRNVSFVAGTGVLYDLVSTDFPHTLIGHAKEIVIRKRFDLELGQVPFEALSRAMEDPAMVKALHGRLLESRKDHTTELGGVATLSHGPEGPRLHLYEIASVNGGFSRDLRKAGSGSVPEFVACVGEEEHRAFLRKVGISDPLVERLRDVLASPRIGEGKKRRLTEQFIATYDLYSESRYLLSP